MLAGILFVTAPDSLFDAALAVHRAGQRGEFSASAVMRGRLSDRGDPGSRALSAALQGQLWRANPNAGELASVEALAVLEGGSSWERSAISLALGEVSRAAILAWDVDTLRRAQSAAGRLRVGGELAELGIAHALREGWLALFEQQPRLAAEHAQSASDAAAQLGASSAVIEAAALRALAWASAGELEEATAVARRASRMARTEAFPQQEYLANVVLARIRRLTGRPHLAMRILTALHPIAPAPWHGWIAWELVLSGASARAAEVELDAALPGNSIGDVARSGASALREALRTAAVGDADGFAMSVDAAAALIGDIAPFREDIAAVRVALDSTAPLTPESDDVVQWCRGTMTRPPPRLRGICADLGAATAEEASAAWVITAPDSPGRRLVAIGASMARAERRLTASRGRPGRVETTVAALALAGDQGLSLPDLFRMVYGFEFDPVVHRNLFKVLVHRARGAVEGAAEIERDGDLLRLRPHLRLLVPDPRCEQPLEELVLRVLAREGRANAKSAASALRIPLRTVQDALRQLADEGAVQLEKDGQRFQYHVEDTTFSEPTRSGSPPTD